MIQTPNHTACNTRNEALPGGGGDSVGHAIEHRTLVQCCAFERRDGGDVPRRRFRQRRSCMSVIRQRDSGERATEYKQTGAAIPVGLTGHQAVPALKHPAQQALGASFSDSFRHSAEQYNSDASGIGLAPEG